MTTKPLVNAGAAFAYIAVVVLFMTQGIQVIEPKLPDYVMGLSMLSLFVLSVAFMGFALISMPLRLIIGGNQKEGVSLFVRTLLYFAVLVLVTLTIAVLSSL